MFFDDTLLLFRFFVQEKKKKRKERKKKKHTRDAKCANFAFVAKKVLVRNLFPSSLLFPLFPLFLSFSLSLFIYFRTYEERKRNTHTRLNSHT